MASPRRRRCQLSDSIRTMPSRWPRCRARSRSCSVRSAASRESRSQVRMPASRDIGWAGVSASGLATRASISPGRDAATVFLPVRIAIFPDRDMNASLYRWLAAWFATVTVTTVEDHDPLRRDLLLLRRARETAAAVLARFPGLVQILRGTGGGDGLPRDPSDRCPSRKGGGEDRARPAGCRGAARQETCGPR